MSGRNRCRRATDAGSAAVEAALIISALLLAVVGGVEFARALWVYNTMLIAVEQAGRFAMGYNHRLPATCTAQTQASQCPPLSDTPLANCSAEYARQVLAAYQAAPVGVSVSVDAAAAPPTITICASRSLDFIAPQLLPYGPFELTSSVTVPMI
jgi:Flp pilus assembly protein TadG